jgi:hypothetical protein
VFGKSQGDFQRILASGKNFFAGRGSTSYGRITTITAGRAKLAGRLAPATDCPLALIVPPFAFFDKHPAGNERRNTLLYGPLRMQVRSGG